jgi:LemA protein
MKDLAGAENMLTQTLGKLMMLTENYPDLKANENMMQLTEELTSTENRIAFSRQAFNDFITDYNNKREKFPNNTVAGMFGFKYAELLESTESAEERKAPKVSFS